MQVQPLLSFVRFAEYAFTILKNTCSMLAAGSLQLSARLVAGHDTANRFDDDAAVFTTCTRPGARRPCDPRCSEIRHQVDRLPSRTRSLPSPSPLCPPMRSPLFDFRVFGGCCAILAEERIYAHPRPICNRMMPVVFSPRDDWSFIALAKP